MMRHLLVLTALVLGPACGIDELLVGAACNEDADCPNLTCVRTASEVSASQPGKCSSDDSCVQGEQAGCIANNSGTCSDSGLAAAKGPDGGDFCCPSGEGIPTVISVSDEDGTAECFDCPLCGQSSSSEEACSADEPRCEVENDGDPCGCRSTDDTLLGENCDDDDDCGALGVCVRTLEQQEEPDEPIDVDRQIEQGVCRSSDAPTCLPGTQSGCEVEPGSFCQGSTTEVDVGSRSYCCEEPSNNTLFQSLPYLVSADLTSVACTACARPNCTDAPGNPTRPVCTSLTNPDCELDAGGVCGCTPEMEE